MSADRAGGVQDGASKPRKQLSERQLLQRGRANLKHGLRAKAAPTVRSRSYRAGRLLSALQGYLPYQLQSYQLPTARRYVSLEVLITDHEALLTKPGASLTSTGQVLTKQYLALVRAQLPYGEALGLTPAAQLSFRKDATAIARDAQAAQERIRASLRLASQPRQEEP